MTRASAVRLQLGVIPIETEPQNYQLIESIGGKYIFNLSEFIASQLRPTEICDNIISALRIA